MVETKDAEKIVISSSFIEAKREEAKIKMILKAAKKAVDDFEDLYVDIENLWSDYEAFSFTDTDYMFYPELNLILYAGEAAKIDIAQYGGAADLTAKMANQHMQEFGCELLTDVEARKIFFDYSKDSRTHNYTQIICKNNAGEIGVLTRDGKFVKLDERVPMYNHASLLGILMPSIPSTARVPVCCHFSKNITKLELLINYNLRPREMVETKLMNNLILLIKKGYASVKGGKVSLTKSAEDAIREGSLKK